MNELFIGIYLNQHFDPSQVPEILLSNKEIHLYSGALHEANHEIKHHISLSYIDSPHQLQYLQQLQSELHILVVHQSVYLQADTLPAHTLVYHLTEDEELHDILKLIYDGMLIFLINDELAQNYLEPIDYKYLASDKSSAFKIIRYDLNNVLAENFQLNFNLHHHLTHSNTTIVNFHLQDCSEASVIRRALLNLFNQIRLDNDHQLFYAYRLLTPQPDLSAQAEYVYLIYQCH